MMAKGNVTTEEKGQPTDSKMGTKTNLKNLSLPLSPRLEVAISNIITAMLRT